MTRRARATLSTLLIALALAGAWVGIRAGGFLAEVPRERLVEPDFEDTLADLDTLVLKFEATVFREDPELGGHVFAHLSRWDGPVAIVMLDEAVWRWEPRISYLARDLGRLTGLQVQVYVASPWLSAGGTLQIGHRPRDEAAAASAAWAEDGQPFPHAGIAMCFGRFLEQDGSIFAAFTFVPTGMTDNQTWHCLVQEITQSFGVLGDSDVIFPSLFSEAQPAPLYLTLNDKLILRALYDPALRPGMPRDEAMEGVRPVLERLVAAYEQGGEAAWDQPMPLQGPE